MATITKPNTFSAGALILAAEHNENFDTLYNDYNGNITDANIASNAAIADTKLDQITADDKVDFSALTITSEAQGDVMYFNGTAWTRLGQSTSGRPLITKGAGANPAFENVGGTPGLTLSTSNSAGSAETYIRTDDTILAFDATVPEAPGTAAAGSATVAARRDHVHPSTGAWQYVETMAMSGTSVSSGALSGTAFLLVFVDVESAGADIGLRFNSVVTNYNFIDRTTVTFSSVTAADRWKLLDAGTSTAINGTVFLSSDDGNANITQASFNITGETVASKVATLWGNNTSGAAITGVTVTGGSTLQGTVYVYKLITA